MSSRTFLVTGASTGIGRATALRLAAGGHTVLAGVRREEDGAALQAQHPAIEPLILDVTDDAHVTALRERLDGAPLHGLVNNAGIGAGGPVEFLEKDELRRAMEVNLIGPVTVTQAALPALRATRGRIVNIGSIGARGAPPFVTPYGASKAALRNLTFGLRRELRPWGIKVALIEPGTIATEIWRKADDQLAEAERSLAPEARPLYGRQIAALAEFSHKQAAAGLPADEVAKAIEHALTARRPRPLYTIGRDARAQAALQAVLPARAMDALVSRAMGL